MFITADRRFSGRSRGRGRGFIPLVCGLVCAVAGGCGELDTTREAAPQQSFGATVVELVCKRMAYISDLEDGDDTVDVRGDRYRAACADEGPLPADAPADLQALDTQRNGLVFAIDTAAPEAFLPDVQAYLTSDEFLAIYDDETKMEAVDVLIDALRFAADDPAAPAAHDAMARLGRRDGTAPLEAVPGLIGALTSYPQLATAMRALTGQLAPGGAAEAPWYALIDATGATLRDAAPASDEQLRAPDRTATLVKQLLFTTNEALAEAAAGDGASADGLEVVARDVRGVPLVRADETGALPQPFVDVDGDGLADIDAVGRFVDADGAVIAAPAPYELAPGDEDVLWPTRDQAGRALVGPDGDTVYEHIDLDETLFAALVRDGAAIIDPDRGAALDAISGLTTLLGPRQDTSRNLDGEAFGYVGFDTSQSALLDMMHGYLQIVRDPAADDLLALLDVLLRDHEPAVARLAESAVAAARLGDAFPEAELTADSPLYDDLMPMLRQVAADPALLADLMRALEDPATERAMLHFRNYMRYSDRFSFDAAGNVTGSFATPVDHSRPDNGFDRSIFQRLIHLITDTNGAKTCNKQGADVRDPVFGAITIDTYNECELLQVDSMALLFVQSMVYAKDQNGNVIFDGGQPRTKATLEFNWNNALIEAIISDGLIADLVGIPDFGTHPTPQALARFLFTEPNDFLARVVDPALDRDDDLIIDEHADTLQVWEVGGFYDDIRPLLQAFADHDQEQLFLDIIGVLHHHWPSRQSVNYQQSNPDGSNYVFASNAVSYEPLIVEILSREQLVPALVAAAPVLNQLAVDGRPVSDVVAGAITWLTLPQDGLARRDGATSTVTGDGRPVETLSPWYVLADAYAAKRAAYDADPAAGEAWDTAVSGLVDVFVRAEQVDTGEDAGEGEVWRFQNPRMRGAGLVAIDFLRQRLAAHRAAGDADSWLSEGLVADSEELLSGPMAAALADFTAALLADPEIKRQIVAMLTHTLDREAAGPGFAAGMMSLADLMQTAMFDDANMIPLAHLAGEAMRPERGWLPPVLDFASAAAEADQRDTLATLFRNLYNPYRRGRVPLDGLVRDLGEVHRARPYSDLGRPFASDDYPAIMRGVAQFLDDEKRGLRKFIAIIRGRRL